MTPRTREERETIIRFDETDELAPLWTASVIQRRRWERLGLLVETFGGGWRVRVDKRRVAVRRERPKWARGTPRSMGGGRSNPVGAVPRARRRARPQNRPLKSTSGRADH